MKKFLHMIAWVLIFLLTFLRFGQSFSSESNGYPSKPIKVVVPFKAGGGSDTFARLIQKAVAKSSVIDQPIVIVNQDGGSGTIGSRKVKNAKPDGYTFLCLHEGIMSAKHSGSVPYGPEAFDAVAQTGDIPMVVVVGRQSPYTSLKNLMVASRDQPDSLRMGTNMGAPPHFTARELEQVVPGSAFNYVQSGGGQKRYALLIGDHIDLALFSLAEYMAFKGDGKIRALAVLLNDRHPGAPEIPTAVEQGIDVVASNAHFWWAPKGTPPARMAIFAEVLKEALKDAEVRERLEQLRIAPVFRDGAALDDWIARRDRAYTNLAFGLSHNLPKFEWWVLGITLGLGVLIVAVKRPPEERTGTIDVPGRTRLALGCLGLLCVYILLLQIKLFPFSVTTALFVALTGGAMMGKRRSAWLVLGELAIITGLGIELVFTRLFGVMLW